MPIQIVEKNIDVVPRLVDSIENMVHLSNDEVKDSIKSFMSEDVADEEGNKIEFKEIRSGDTMIRRVRHPLLENSMFIQYMSKHGEEFKKELRNLLDNDKLKEELINIKDERIKEAIDTIGDEEFGKRVELVKGFIDNKYIGRVEVLTISKSRIYDVFEV